MVLFVFFFNDTATTEIYTLSLHDALPILGDAVRGERLDLLASAPEHERVAALEARDALALAGEGKRSEEHTSELQSQSNLVCRLLLEKKQICTMACCSQLHVSRRTPRKLL